MTNFTNLTDAQIIKIAQEHKRKRENGQIILVCLGALLSSFAFLGALLNDGFNLDSFDFLFTYGAPFILGILTIGFAIVCKYENK
jgi:hypothetical protein